MGKQLAVAIAVAKAGDLPELPGAINGAKDFLAWADRNHYEPHLVSDETGAVTVDRLRDLFTELVGRGDAERLLVYFAGHGLQPSYNMAFWLLSKWQQDSDEAINVNLFFANAKRSDLTQIAVFSDACRSTSNEAQLVGGAAIFPRSQLPGANAPQWDHYLACRLGDVAQEVPDAKPEAAFGIFTRCLMRGLAGEDERALDHWPGPPPSKLVTSHSLARFLMTSVPEESGRTRGAQVQFPDVSPGWISPGNVYLGYPVREASAEEDEEPDVTLKELRYADREDRANVARHWPIDPPDMFYDDLPDQPIRPHWDRPRPGSAPSDAEAAIGLAVEEAERLADEAVENSSALFAASEGRASFETRMGLSIVGARPRRVLGRRGGPLDPFLEDGIWNVRGYGEEPQTVFIELDRGNWVGSVIIPGFVGTITINRDVAASVSYAPAGSIHDRASFFDRIAPVVNRWMALMHQGRSGDPDEIEHVIAEAGDLAMFNPTFVTLAAYAYERAGVTASIDRLADYFIQEGRAVPYEIALLSTLPFAYRRNRLRFGQRGDHAVVAGSFPLLTQGWSYLNEDAPEVAPGVLSLRRDLVPSLWTTFRPEAITRIAKLIDAGEI